MQRNFLQNVEKIAFFLANVINDLALVNTKWFASNL